MTTITSLHFMGGSELLQRNLLGLLVSIRCPGEAIIGALDTARVLRDAGVAVVGGFHSPMEKECLALLLRGTAPVVICPARSLDGMRVPRAWRDGIDVGRVLLVSQFDAKHRRATAELAEARNRLVADLAARVLVIHAEPGGKTDRLARDLLAAGREVHTFDLACNAHLLVAGAEPWKANSPDGGHP